MDDRQRAISYGQATNIAADYILSAYPPGELSFKDFQSLLNDYTNDVYQQIIKGQGSVVAEPRGVVTAQRAAADAAIEIAKAAKSTHIPPDEPYRGDEPPMEAYLDAEPKVAAQAFPQGDFHFDIEGSTWQRNTTVPCPACAFPSQLWDSKWEGRKANANGNYPPAYRCGSHKWDKTLPNQYGGKFPGAWAHTTTPPCDWVAWRDR